MMPRSCNRLLINKGLLHSDILVQHGTIRLLLEALKFVDNLDNFIGSLLDSMYAKESSEVSWASVLSSMGDLLNPSETSQIYARKGDDSCRSNDDVILQKWVAFKGQIQDEVRSALPDPQVLLKLLASFTSGVPKRGLNSPEVARKKLKSMTSKDVSEVDIVVSVKGSSDTAEYCENNGNTSDTDAQKQQEVTISEIWGTSFDIDLSKTENVMVLFHAKLIDALRLYLRALPLTLEGSFDFMKILTSNPLKLSTTLQESVVSLLVEYTVQECEGQTTIRAPPAMHKSLHVLIGLFLFSPIQTVRSKALTLAKRALLNTGAFDQNISEIEAWLHYLPGYCDENLFEENQGALTLKNLYSVGISFFCEAISTVANNLYKYLDQLRAFVIALKDQEDVSPDFSPLVICILQKCIRVLESDSMTFNLSERSMISLYVRNSISFILQTQVNLTTLPGIICFILKEKLNEPLLGIQDSRSKSLCEWRPLNELLLLATNICEQQSYYPSRSLKEKAAKGDATSFDNVLNSVRKVLKSNDKDSLFATASAMCVAIVCTNPDEVLKKLPMLAAVVHGLPSEHIQFLSFVLIQSGFLGNDADLWNKIFLSYKENKGGFFLNEDLQEIDASEKYSGFRLLTEHTPFYDLFNGVVKSQICCRSNLNDLLGVLSAKLEPLLTGDWRAPLRFLLFWAHQIRLGYNRGPYSDLEHIFGLCTCFANHIFDKTIKQSSKSEVWLAVDLIVRHPVVIETILHPLCNGMSKEGLGVGPEILSNCVHRMDDQILQLLKRAGELLQVSRTESNSRVNVSAIQAFTQLMERLVLMVKQIFDKLIMAVDLGSNFPSVYTFHTLSEFISPFKLMEIVEWMLDKIEDNIGDLDSTKSSALSFFFHFSNVSLENLCGFLKNPTRRISSFLWEPVNSTTSTLPNLYRKFVELAICFKLDSVDTCLLKLVNIMYFQKLETCVSLSPALPSSMLVCRMVMSSSMKLIIHCVYETSKTKARILFELVQASPLHRKLFFMIFLKLLKVSDLLCNDISITDVIWPAEIQMVSANYNAKFSDDDLLLLLPASLSCITCAYRELRTKDLKSYQIIPHVYSNILLKSFEGWKTFSSGTIFHEDFRCSAPALPEELLSCFGQTHLGKAINMLHLSFICNVLPMMKRRRREIFHSLFDNEPPFDQLLDISMSDIGLCSAEDAFNIVNRAMAKTYFAQMLLFPSESFTPYSEVNFNELSETTSSSRWSARLRFLNVLFQTLSNLVNKFSCNIDFNGGTDTEKLFRFLECHILGIIVQLSLGMKNVLTQLPTISFLLPFVKTSLLHRFDDPTTLRAIRILVGNLEARSSAMEILELLLGHSKFINTILWNGSNIDLPASIDGGTSLQPLTSIFKLLDQIVVKVDDASFEIGDNDKFIFMRKLELIKLLRVLFSLKDPQENVSVDSTELISLLLSGYSATPSQIDLQVLYLMHEIESLEGHSIAAMDYLWGKSAIEVRRENIFSKSSSNSMAAIETEDERHQRLFRENIPLDSKRCMMTALNFCHKRAELTELTSLKSLLLENSLDLKVSSPKFCDTTQTYDPGFLLPFSIHCLRRRYIEPVEFARLGLLAVLLVSISSADEDIRRLGYEALGIFKAILESFRSNRDILQLQLLLAYLQNGITEEYEKISSLSAIFAAEASFILLDMSHYCFQVISKFLLQSPKADFKDLPLFHLSHASHSIHFKANFSWILKLLYVGVNFDDDARIVERKHLFELLMSLYVSSLSDPETKLFTLQIMKKSSKLSMPANVLVKYHALIPWIASVIKWNAERLQEDQKIFSMGQIETAVEVINNVVSWRPISKWLEDSGLEQLSDLSQLLHRVLVDSTVFLKERINVMDSMLSVIISTLKLSQERDVSKPHFIFSIEASLQLCHSIGLVNSGPITHSTVRLGLTAILMSTPPAVRSQTDKSKLLEVSFWAFASCRLDRVGKSSLLKTNIGDDESPSEEGQAREAFLPKLLRWISASIILGCMPVKNYSREIDGESLQTFLGKIRYVENDDFKTSMALAAFILHLQYLVGTDCKSLSSSAVSALSVLLRSHFQSGNSMSIISSLCEKIRYPAEASSSWKWCFHKPWRDLSKERTHLQELEEEQSSEALLLFFSNALSPDSNSHVHLYQEVQDSGLFEWEKSLIIENDTVAS
ncbi:ribosome 60S biogenesis amino-terminal protein isoform X2 [Wolffia australiana]